MPIHHLNCMTFRFGVPSITHCLLLETAEGLVLVDTGLGLDDHERPTRKMRIFQALNRVPNKPQETAIRQVVKLGYTPEDVRHIILTHLHLDHCGGLPDFPWAKVHVLAAEHQAATQEHQKGFINWFGYEAEHWAHGPDWVLYEPRGEEWFGLPCATVQGIESVRIRLVPLIGHSAGHCGVAIQTDDGWLMHCGDAYVRDVQIDPVNPGSPFPRWMRIFDKALFPSAAHQILQTLQREHGGEIKLFASHDRIKFAEMRPNP